MKLHLSLPISDIKKTQKFYDQLFNSSPVKIKPDYIKYEPDHLALNISFHTSADNIDTNRHMGIQFPSQESLNKTYKQLKQAGLISQEKETAICCYANQDKFWVKDNDGHEWELYYLLEDTDIKIEANTGCCTVDTVDMEKSGLTGHACC